MLRRKAFPVALAFDVRSHLIEKGYCFDELADEVGMEIDNRTLPGSSVDFKGIVDLMRLCAARTRNDALGLELARKRSTELSPLLHYIVSNAPNVSEALHARCRFLGLATNAYGMSLFHRKTRLALRWDFPVRDLEPLFHFILYDLTFVITRMRLLSTPSWRPVHIFVSLPPAPALVQLSHFAGCSVSAEADVTGLEFDLSSGAELVTASDPALYKEVRAYGRHLLGLTPDEDDLLARVGNEITTKLIHGRQTN